jgi:hypothetical protein
VKVPKNAKPRSGEPRQRNRQLAIQYRLFAFLSNIMGSVFWWAEQRKWQIADRLEDLEVQR